jgi:hypothetical protein
MSVAQPKLNQNPSSGVYSPRKRQFSAPEKAQYRQKQGQKIAAKLFLSAAMNGDAEMMARADCIAETASSDNLYCSVDQMNFETGELYDGNGSLLETVASRFCPSYLSKASRRARKQMREALARVKPKRFDLQRFITLTMPNLQTDFETTIKILFRAFSLLKKREIFTRNVTGAIYGYENTRGANNDHHHAHVHILAWSGWINQSELAAVWTDCVKRACAEIGVQCLVATSSGQMIVDIRLARRKATGRGTIAVEDALQEVCKYVTKGSDFCKMPVAELAAIERVLQHRQMVGTYGECNVRKGKAERSKPDEIYSKRDSLTSVHTPNINDGVKVKLKRDNLVKIGTRMILDGNRAEWLELLRRKMQERRAFRKRQLAMLYPTAKFCTLSGAAWSLDDYLLSELPENVVYLRDWKQP